MKHWTTRRYRLSLDRPLIMGIVNTTPDSFSDGGMCLHHSAAIAHAEQLIKQGADILDIGGESTRPGAQAVDAQTEWERVGPVLQALVQWNVPVSIDTMKTEVMHRALDMGVDILNDVNGFRAPGAAELLARYQAGGVVMHMRGEPRTMQNDVVYEDVVSEVVTFLAEQLAALAEKNALPEQLLVDPGFGFGKTLEHNLELLRATPAFAQMAAGVLVGVSRKSMIGQLTGRSNPQDRVYGSVAAALYAAQAGAAVLRVHDVQATHDALKVWQALTRSPLNG